ncbi:MAG: PASTA domain-containing protein [Chloroflexi bacterium]|nr:MAG: PASTA domain-containing protein [Chloroflexota bacterium]
MNWPGAGRRAERAEAEASATVVADEIRERARRIGDILRQSRVDRGVTLADVEQDIRINRVYIEALENARFEELPAPVYARGFMRSYARYLGLDPDEALRAVPRDLPRPRDLDPMPGLRRAMPSTLPAMPRLNPPMAIGIGAAVVLLVVALIFVPRLGGSTGITSTPTPTASATVAVNIAAPNLVGMTREAATSTLDRESLTPLIFPQANAAPPGTVFRQSPGAGEPVRRGDVVTLFVSQDASPTATSTPTSTPSATPSRTPTPTPAR